MVPIELEVVSQVKIFPPKYLEMKGIKRRKCRQCRRKKRYEGA